jgi:hypothetical protein
MGYPSSKIPPLPAYQRHGRKNKRQEERNEVTSTEYKRKKFF